MERKEAGMWRWEQHRTARTMQYGAAKFPLGEVRRLRNKAPFISRKILGASGLRHQILTAWLSTYRMSTCLDQKIAKICASEPEQFHINLFYHIWRSSRLSRP